MVLIVRTAVREKNDRFKS